jgi:hypothetical protein
MNDKLYIQLLKIPRANLIVLMMNALDEMQSYNGRTRMECIAIALGLESREKEDGTMIYRLPTVAEIKKSTQTYL